MGVDTSPIIISNISNRCSCMVFKMSVFSKTTFQKNKHHTILKYNPTMPQFQSLINYKELIFLKNRKPKNQQFKHQKILIFFNFKKSKTRLLTTTSKKKIASQNVIRTLKLLTSFQIHAAQNLNPFLRLFDFHFITKELIHNVNQPTYFIPIPFTDISYTYKIKSPIQIILIS